MLSCRSLQFIKIYAVFFSSTEIKNRNQSRAFLHKFILRPYIEKKNIQKERNKKKKIKIENNERMRKKFHLS